MRRARRAAHLFFKFSDDLLPDVERLLRGELELVRQARLLAISLLTGRELAISPDELRLLWALPSDRWTAVADLRADSGLVEKLAHDGLVVCDEGGGELADLRRRDDRLSASGWDPYAALYHSRSRWRDVDVGRLLESSPMQTHEAAPAFHERPHSLATVELPLATRENGFFGLLARRRTTRSFDPAPLTREELATILYYTFGCQGYARIRDDVVLLRKTSPSGGSLHPLEVYPLVVGVEDVDPGLYHYRADRHALDLVERIEPDAARQRLVRFAAGQPYLASANVLLILTARFPRSFWKYRESSRTFAVLLMDAGHLSQTLYLVCAELGLGAFVSAAVNAANIEDCLGLDSLEEGVLAVCGCGRPARERSPFDTEFEPYVPRETVIETPSAADQRPGEI